MFVKFFKRLENVAVCNMFIICSNSKSKHISHKSQVLLNLTDHQSTIHQKTSWEALHSKDLLYMGGGGMGQEEKKIAKKLWCLPITKEKEGSLTRKHTPHNRIPNIVQQQT